MLVQLNFWLVPLGTGWGLIFSADRLDRICRFILYRLLLTKAD